MKISFRWLSELLPGLTASPLEVAEQLTMHSFETAVVGQIAIDPSIIVAKIVKLETHPNADRLRLATVTTGKGTLRVVCGAANISEGDLVPCSLPGAKLHDETGRRFTLKAATIRGEPSPGMLNSPRELGLGSDSGGIYVLPPDTPLGSKLCEHLPADTILEADVTLNRAHDCQSMLGMARELGCLLQLPVAEPQGIPLPAGSMPGWTIAVHDPHDAPRYLGILIEGVAIAPSPLWLQARLWACGVRPLNNVVDITNYVLFEQGNPLHAFDADFLPGRDIAVRCAKPSEPLTALDGKQYSLAGNHLVIASSDTPVAIAGVMGALGSEVRGSTRTVFLEVANFQPERIQRASAELKVITESSRRFARGLSPALVEPAAQRALILLLQLAGGMARGCIEYYPQPAVQPVITFRPAQVARFSRLKVPRQQQADILRRLRCTVRPEHSPWQVTPPLDRLDLTAEHDLAEEIIRVVGLEQIADVAVKMHPPAQWPRLVQVREYIRDALVASGLVEVYNRPFEHRRFADVLGLATSSGLSIANPSAPELTMLRTNLLPQLCANVVANKGEVRRQHSLKSRSLFEINSVWRTGASQRVPGIIEEEQVAAVIVDELDPAAIVTSLLEELSAAAALRTSIITVGEFAADALSALKLPPGIRYFSISLTDLLSRVPANFRYEPPPVVSPVQYLAPSPFPPSFRDLSLLVPLDITAEAVQEIIIHAGGSLLVNVELFDEYAPPAARRRARRKGLAFHLTYQAPDRTLTDDEIAAAHGQITGALTEKIDATIRE